MSKTSSKTVKIQNAAGLHARAAAKLVQLCARFKSEIKVIRGRCAANAKSIMGVMMLAAGCGSRLIIRARGADAKKAVAEIAALIQDKFGEGK